MRVLITCGPTYEPLDEVRRLTNFSTGKLGTGLANHLVDCGHEVHLLRGSYATFAGPCRAQTVVEFTTSGSLAQLLQERSAEKWDAVFHAAAVSDFRFGAVYERTAGGELRQITSGKFSTRHGPLLAELIPTPKIISSLRELFPPARIIGWKYEMVGGREDALAAAERQIQENRTDGCVVNGRAYGAGYGVVGVGNVQHCPTPEELYARLETLARS